MLSRLKHILRVLLTGSAFLLFFVGGTVLATILLPIVRLKPGTPEEKAARCRQWVSESWVFFHDYMRVLGLIHYDPRALRQPLPDGPVVVIANHPTLIDVTALISMWSRLVCVAKPVHFRSPLIGRLLRYCGYIEGGDAGIFTAATVVTKGVDALRKGAAILVFPEGTRSPKNGLHPFRAGAFEMAARANAPILPVFVTCNPPTLMRGQGWYEVPERTARLSVTPLPLIHPPHANPSVAAREMHREYRARLDAFLAQREVPRALSADEPVRAQAG